MTPLDDINAKLAPNVILRGPAFPEAVQVIVVTPVGTSYKIVGRGLQTNRSYQPILSPAQIALLTATPEHEPFDGNAHHFKLGVEALRLGLAHEYDPLFSLSVARIDPLPHQVEAVYDYFLKLPRIRFLLADDPGAGKTIMAGLLIKELKARGLVQRILIVTPANLTFQWQREMKDKFRESFDVVRGDVLRSVYGANPWQDNHQVITSISWVSRMEDARESLLRSQWDLVIVDEAHKMSAYAADKKTLAYRLGEALSDLTDHYLLMTATPHKGDPENFRRFLELLDKDVYGDVRSLHEAMRRHHAPFYLRRVKEALVTFPNPETGEVRSLFTKRFVRTADFQIDADERALYDLLTEYVEDQSIRASVRDPVRGRALGFTMAMLQRRFASSVYALRRSLERMREKRESILQNPAAYRQEQIAKKLPENFDELPEDDRQDIMAALEGVVASVDPTELKAEIRILTDLIDQACSLEQREVETKLVRLREVLQEQGLFDDPRMKLLIFTEHKDTLDYLIGKLREWNLTTTQIHGGMKIGSRDEPGTRIYAEREFREEAQVLVATEAAGEGINLQFCWLMINYDIPWNPVRLEQRMGRIHRYGQEKDCLVFNFVSTNTREGRVLQKLFQRLREIEQELDPDRTGKIFNVLGDVLPALDLENMVREMYARNQTEEVIISRIVQEVDVGRFRRITNSMLEGLAKRELNLASVTAKRAEAKVHRLVPEVIEQFFLGAAGTLGLQVRAAGRGQHIYRAERIPASVKAAGDRLEPRLGPLGKEYRQLVFDKELLGTTTTAEWVTPGHPLFESVREATLAETHDDMRRGALFYDLHRADPARLDVYVAAISDGRGNTLHRRLFVVETRIDGAMDVRQPTLFHELLPASAGRVVPDDGTLPSRDQVVEALMAEALTPFLDEVSTERAREIATVAEHMHISLNAIIDRIQLQYAELTEQRDRGSQEAGLDGRIQALENRLVDLNDRLERRAAELEQERVCMLSDIQHVGRAWVLPHPERDTPAIRPMVRDEEIERIAVQEVTKYEEARGWKVESVERDNLGFDLISRRFDTNDPEKVLEVRNIEVKGRAATDLVVLTPNEYRTAERLGEDYWLYVVFDCATQPRVQVIRDPARLSWEPVVKIEHYCVGPTPILRAAGDSDGNIDRK